MLYTTVDEWKLRYPKIIETNVASEALYAFIDEASTEADGYLATAGITVPVTPAPPVLVGKVCALAFVTFMERNIREAGRDQGIENMRKSVLDWFQALIDGNTTLVTSGGEALGAGVVPDLWSNLDGYVPTFGAGPIEDAEVDPDREIDEDNARYG